VTHTEHPIGLNRREFLIRTGWLAAGVTVLGSCSRLLPALPTRDQPRREDASFWLQALPDGRIRFLLPRSEMGQGIVTGLTQVVAEELDLPGERIECLLPDTRQIPAALMTVGSWSMQEFFDPVSIGAATLRETLRARAAARAGVAPAQVRHDGGAFVLPDGSRLEYADLVTGAAQVIDATLGAEAVVRYSLDRTRARRAVGQPWQQVDIEKIVTGRAVYSRDVVVSGMLYGQVARPPRLQASLKAVNQAAAMSVPGVVKIVVDKGREAAGVIADNPFVLAKALEALAPEWEGGLSLSQPTLDEQLDVDRAVERDSFQHTVVDDGDIEAGARAAVEMLDARYSSPMLAHGAVEARAAVASVTDDAVEVWAAAQDPWFVRSVIAKLLGRSNEAVRLQNHRMGGAFGGRTLCQAAVEAAWLSNAVRRPVRVEWSREEEFRHNHVLPPFSHRIRAGLDGEGRIAFWTHDLVSCPIVYGSSLIPSYLLPVLDFFATDEGTMRNVVPPYVLANRRVRFSARRIALSTGAWRSLGATPNTFATESAMDELARLARADPLDWRLRHLPADRPRLEAVLQKAAQMSRWGTPTPKGVGRGVACAIYKEKSYVATVVEVEVDEPASHIAVRRAYCAHDCGLVVSPDQVKAQIEGNVAWGCSMSLLEGTAMEAGAIAASNYHDYPVLRNEDMPDVETALLEHPGDPPSGAGETALLPMPAAIANAVFAATGKRLRALPLRLDAAS
jgi:CO/xanthine dehydrogenase Mo-binding subunit